MKTDKELDVDFFKKNEKIKKIIQKNQREDAIEEALKKFLLFHVVMTVVLISLNFLGMFQDISANKSLEVATFVKIDYTK